VVLAPQAGLLPLGADPDSGLFEFAVHLPGCTVPERDPASRELVLSDDSTIVLVLLPGGVVEVGCQGVDPELPFYDPYASEYRWPVVERELLPFFLSKFEVTQFQWRALTGENPSYWHVGKQHEGQVMTPRHPVESIPWLDALEFSRKLGMTLPTEVQFEHAARGGSIDATWWGTAEEWDPDRVNLLWTTPGSRDVHRLHAPVGTFPANGFGLHEVTGNVAEMCLDDYKLHPWREPYRPGDALVLADGGGEQSVRGGSYDEVTGATVTCRGDIKKEGRARTVGFRPLRYLEGRAPAQAVASLR
jgi:formylglycine-generating enzyme required for sulfatase activity